LATHLCPYLYPPEGTSGDRALPTGMSAVPEAGRMCGGLRVPAPVDSTHQASYCLSANHARCSVYVTAEAEQALQPVDASAPHAAAPARSSGLRRHLPWIALGAVLLLVAAIYISELAGAGPTVPTRSAAALPAAQATSAGIVAASATPTPTATLTPAASPARASVPTASSSPVANSTLVLQPVSGGSGWWASGDTIAEHLQDSFLYAGYYEQRTIISAFAFELHRVSRGAPVLDARIELTGLNADKFEPNRGGTWSLQLLDPAAAPELNRSGFQALYNAPVAVSLFPTLSASDLGAGKRNVVVLDAEGREWLEQQILDGSTTIVVRIVGPGGGDETLFGWDSGAGPGTRGNPPQLTLTLGPAPKTPPPLATPRLMVATVTATPENVLTAAAHAATVMAEAAARGGTPAPYLIVTPTPPAENLATAQAIAFTLGLPPLAIHTPTPANEATATADALHATAVAMTTGTFTPTPVGAVTPVIIMPTVIPMNAATALAQVLTATAQVQQFGTETPRPPNVLVATATVTPIAPVATPANPATAAVRAAEATLTAIAQPAVPAAATPAPVAQGPTAEAPPESTATATPAAGPPGTGAVEPATPTVQPSPVRPANTPTRPPTARPAVAAVAPKLLEPANEASGSQFTFRWEPLGPLPAGAGYEVVCWNEGEDSAAARGIAPPVQETVLHANLDPAGTSGLFQTRRLHCTVIVVRIEGYTRLTQPGAGEVRSVNR
jgi:hypothetical protein